MAPELDLRHPDNLQNPYPLYQRLRAEHPVHWSEGLRGWTVSRYDDCLEVFQHPLRFSADRFRKLGTEFRSSRPAVQDVARVLQDWLVFRDPPDHTRMRRLLHNAFTPRELEQMKPRIQRVVDELYQRVIARCRGREGEMDFIADFAFPLPASVIAIMLGAPVEDIDALKRWSDQIAAFLGGTQAAADTGALDNMDEARQGALAMVEYFRALIARRRAAPRDDLISLMLAAQDDGDRMTPEEVVNNSVLLLAAGHETTTNLLGNGLYLLLRNPRAFRALRGNPELVPGAVEEFLRVESPVPAMTKVAAERAVLAGREIQPGEMVFPLVGSANRDERQFERPDELELARRPNRHLAFGHGIHFCLGAPLARVEAQIAFATLLRRFDEITLAEREPRWMPMIFLRGLQSLRVAFRANAVPGARSA